VIKSLVRTRPTRRGRSGKRRSNEPTPESRQDEVVLGADLHPSAPKGGVLSGIVQ
jgi:hypothetical protein